jgi:PPP family 3-phenylpropionic acid transporter
VTISRLRALFAAEGVSLGLLMPFLVPILVDRGLGPAEIGLALGASGLASLLAYPVWGTVADGRLGRRRTIALTGATAALGGILILLAGSDPLLITLALSVATVGALPWGPLIDALTLQELAEPSAAYGRVRAWASVGWAAAAIIAGAAWLLVGPGPIFVAFSVSALAVAALVLLPTVRPASQPPGPPLPRNDSHVAHRATRPLIAQLAAVASPVLLGFMLGLFVTSIGEHASWRFISLHILEQGGGVFLVGVAAALPAIVEIPVFGSSRRLLARLGLRMMYVWGALIAAALMLLVAVALEAWMVTALRTLDGASYALRYMAMVVIVGALLPRHLHALGQSLAWFIYAGVAPIVADVVGGLVYEHFGAQTLFLSATLTLLVGGTLVWLALRGPRFGRGASGAVIAAETETLVLPTPA